MRKKNSTTITKDMLAKGGRYIRIKPEIVKEIQEEHRQRQREYLARVERESLEIYKLLTGSRSNPIRVDALECVLVEMSNQSHVGVTDSLVVQAFYLQAMLALFRNLGDDQQVLTDMQTVLNPRTNTETLKLIAARYKPGESEADDLPNPIDLNCWRQSRPRPLKGKEGSDAEN